MTDKTPKVCTTDGLPPKYPHGTAGAPKDINPLTGQHEAYWVLCEEERAKGFVRPVRDTYIHVGPEGPKYPTRDLTIEEHSKYDKYGYVQFEAYPEPNSVVGRYWTQQDLDRIGKGCGARTTMGQALSETYARDPQFYGSTFCTACCAHFPVGEAGEFVWASDGTKVGT